MNDNKSKDIFYGVVAIATLIVALVGATLAYFSITAKSPDNAVGAHSDVVSIVYEDSAQVSAQANKLIPASLDVVKQAYEKGKAQFTEATKEEQVKNHCLDSNGKEVCSIYRFSVSSSQTNEITATLNNEENGFSTGLNFALYEVSTGGAPGSGWMDLGSGSNKVGLSMCTNTDENPENDCFTLGEEKTYKPDASKSIFGYDEMGAKKITLQPDHAVVYDLVLFLEDNKENQNIDQGKEYKGTIIVNIDGKENGQITGQMN